MKCNICDSICLSVCLYLVCVYMHLFLPECKTIDVHIH